MEIWTAVMVVTLALAFAVEVIRRRVLNLVNIGNHHRAKG
jgi:hypothetical protein